MNADRFMSIDTGLIMVYFASGSWELDTRARESIAEIAASVRRQRERSVRTNDGYEVTVLIHGYSDSVGSRAAAQTISERRAIALGCALIAEGVQARIFTHGFGKTNLAVPTPDNTPEQRNRRAQAIPRIGDLSHEGALLDPAGCRAPRARR
jgi:outer membrane protein OmpA-like peptidoglycan-associated protein